MRERAEVIENFKVARNQFLLAVKAPHISKEVSPGQFVMIKINETTDPLLPRPFTISFASGEEVEIIYKVVGKTTSLMSNLKSGNSVILEGPFGKGFEVVSDRCLLVGGGVGVASLRFLSWEVHKRGGVQFLLYGERERENLLPLHYLFPSEIKKKVVLEEEGNLVTDFLISCISEYSPDVIYACGPKEMLKVVSSKFLGKVQLAVEEVMACGRGHCYGCVIKTPGGYVRVCREGPVFWREEIDWI